MTSTGKKARKRYGNRFAAKRRRSDGSKPTTKKSRKRFGKLAFSCEAKNVPEVVVRANDEATSRIAAQRADAGWEPDANVAVPGKTFATWDAEQKSIRERERREAKLRRRREREAEASGRPFGLDEDDEE